MVHDADRKDEVERRRLQRERLQVRLQERRVEPGAERAGLLDGGGMIGSDDGRPGLGADLAVASAAAAGVENSEAAQLAERDARLGGEGGPVFVVVSDLVAVPLPAEAGQVLVVDEAGDAVPDGPGDVADGAADFGFRCVE